MIATHLHDTPWRSIEITSEVIEPSWPYATTDYDAVWDCTCGTTHRWERRDLVAATPHAEEYWCPDCLDDHTDDWWACDTCGERLSIPTKTVHSRPIIRYYVNAERVTVEQFHLLTERWHHIPIYEFPATDSISDVVAFLDTYVAPLPPNEVIYR